MAKFRCIEHGFRANSNIEMMYHTIKVHKRTFRRDTILLTKCKDIILKEKVLKLNEEIENEKSK